MRHDTSRTQPRTDIDLALERTGSMRTLSAEDRAAFIRVADLLGCHTAAQHIRDDERRRERVHAAPPPAPRPGPKPKATPPREPIMNLVRGGAEVHEQPEVEPRARAYQHVFDGLDRAAAEDGLSATQRSVFLRLRALAAAGAERRPLEPAPSQ